MLNFVARVAQQGTDHLGIAEEPELDLAAGGRIRRSGTISRPSGNGIERTVYESRRRGIATERVNGDANGDVSELRRRAPGQIRVSTTLRPR